MNANLNLVTDKVLYSRYFDFSEKIPVVPGQTEYLVELKPTDHFIPLVGIHLVGFKSSSLIPYLVKQYDALNVKDLFLNTANNQISEKQNFLTDHVANMNRAHSLVVPVDKFDNFYSETFGNYEIDVQTPNLDDYEFFKFMFCGVYYHSDYSHAIEGTISLPSVIAPAVKKYKF